MTFPGMLIFAIATVFCMVATSISMLIVSRSFQAIGACSGMIIGRAIVGDRYSKIESAKIFATIFPFVGLSPAIAPVIGSLISTTSNWRLVFAFVLLLSAMLLLLILFILPETKAMDKRVSIHPKTIVRQYKHVSTKISFWHYALVPCFGYIAYFGYIAESPFIFHKFQYSTIKIGFFYISLSISYLIGNYIAKKCVSFLKLDTVILLGRNVPGQMRQKSVLDRNY